MSSLRKKILIVTVLAVAGCQPPTPPMSSTPASQVNPQAPSGGDRVEAVATAPTPSADGTADSQTTADSSTAAASLAEPISGPWEPRPNDQVLARWSPGKFYQAVIDAVGKENVYLLWEDGNNVGHSQRSQVIRVPQLNAAPAAKAGDLVVAKVFSSTYWPAAEVVSVAAPLWKVRVLETGEEYEVTSEKVQSIPPEVLPEFEALQAEYRFLQEAKSKLVRIPADFVPEVGANVVAEWTPSSWHEGTVEQVTETDVVVKWSAGFQSSKVAKEKVHPRPQETAPLELSEKQFVLAKSPYGSEWTFAQVVTLSETTLQLKDGRDEMRDANRHDVIPIW